MILMLSIIDNLRQNAIDYNLIFADRIWPVEPHLEQTII